MKISRDGLRWSLILIFIILLYFYIKRPLSIDKSCSGILYYRNSNKTYSQNKVSLKIQGKIYKKGLFANDREVFIGYIDISGPMPPMSKINASKFNKFFNHETRIEIDENNRGILFYLDKNASPINIGTIQFSKDYNSFLFTLFNDAINDTKYTNFKVFAPANNFNPKTIMDIFNAF